MSIVESLGALTPGSSVKFTVNGRDQNGNRIELPSPATFSTESVDIATVAVDPESSDLATITAVAQGQTTLVVALGDLSWSTPVSVVAPVLTSLSVDRAE